MARYEAEERIEARERKAETQIKSGIEGRILPDEVTAHVQGPRGESAAIIAQKVGVKTRNVYEVRAAKTKGVPEVESMQWLPSSNGHQVPIK